MKFLVPISVFMLAVGVYQSNGMCNTCSTLNTACTSRDTFKICSEGMPISDSTIKCPSGSICSSIGPAFCAPEGSTQPSCTKCGVCDDNQLFACTDYNQFALCLGTDAPDNKNFTCPRNTVCNIGAPTICVQQEITGLGGTCPWKNITTPTDPSGEVITPTPNALLSPDEFCAQKKFSGRFEVSADPTCKNYINCVYTTSGWSGFLYECPKKAFFNPKTTMCGAAPPERCNVTVTTVTPTVAVTPTVPSV